MIKEILETQKIAQHRFWQAHRTAWERVRRVSRETFGDRQYFDASIF
jgi:hypothetical protein